VTRTLGTLTDARQWVAKTRGQVEQGTYTAPSRVTVQQLADDWLTSRRDIREVSLNGYRQVLAPVLARIGQRPAQSITREELDRLVEWCRTEGGTRGRGLSQRSIVYTLGALRQVFDYGVSTGVLPGNPARYVKAPRRRKGDHRQPQVWEPVGLLGFRAVSDADEWAAGWRLTLCGLRRSEVLGLSWEHVDLDAGAVTVAASRVVVGRKRTATDDVKSDASGRSVPVESMHPGTVALLRREWLRQGRPAAGLVVINAAGEGVHPDAYSERFRELSRQAGLDVIRLHEVRHTIATALHRAGVAPADAAALLGHTVATHLSVYVAKTERGAASAADAFGEVLAAVR
jgi:integrase